MFSKIGFSSGITSQEPLSSLRMFDNDEIINLPFEVSALREHEICSGISCFLIIAGKKLNFKEKSSSFLSLHLPSKLIELTEQNLIDTLKPITNNMTLELTDFHMVVHPTIIKNIELWKPFQSKLTIENMDKRSNNWSHAFDFVEIFKELKESKLCFDIGHAIQVDPTMKECDHFVEMWKDRISHIHLSKVDEDNKHQLIDEDFSKKCNSFIKKHGLNCPIILETPAETIEKRNNQLCIINV